MIRRIATQGGRALWFFAFCCCVAPADFPGVQTIDPYGEERNYLANIRQLTGEEMGLLNAGEAYFSPDAKTIIFQGTPLGATEYQIYTLDLRTGALKMVSTGKGSCTCAHFRPDGKKIIFASSHLGPADQPARGSKEGEDYQWHFNAYMDIFEADPDGSNLRRLTHADGYDAESTFSPDGRRIVFTSRRDSDLELYMMDADGANQRRLTKAQGYDGGAFFSPDGKTILFRADRRNDGKMNLQLRLIDADGGNDRAITDNELFNWAPYWHPYGRSLIFTQVDHAGWSRGVRPNYDLFMMTIDGGHLTRITFDPAFDGLPVFGPGGGQLMWTSRRGGLEEPQIFLADFTLPEGFRSAAREKKSGASKEAGE